MREILRGLFLILIACGVSSTLCAKPVKKPPPTIEDRIKQFGTKTRASFLPAFKKAKVSYPPKELGFLVLKKERLMEVWARDDKGKNLKFIKSYPMTAFCGTLGPKQKEGDCQIPEGIYKINLLNPNSSYHLSMEVNYPNAFDKEMGKADGRTNLGSLIYIHGRDVTIGCVPLGDPAIEEVFIMAAQTGHRNIEVVMSPLDFRKEFDDSGLLNKRHLPVKPEWVSKLYPLIKAKINSSYAGEK